MRKTILTQMIQQVKKARFGLIMLFLAVSFQQAHAQVDCNSVMACNDNLQVSLDENCEAIIVADFILEAQSYDDSFYTVTLTDAFGNFIPNATVNTSHIGQEISATVSLNGCSLSCWGSFTVEDKLPPVIVDCNELFLDCDIDPDAFPVNPVAYDACTAVYFGYSDVETDLGCTSIYSKIIVRSWLVVDDYGNTSNCDQNIYILQGSLDDIVWPVDHVGANTYSCDQNIPLLDSGAPDPSYTGFPSNIECGNIQYFYEDIIFPICGSSSKTIRRWTVINWCTGLDTVHIQTIKIMDNVDPICYSSPNDFYTIGTDLGYCTGTFTVPRPIVSDCSDWDYDVAYKTKDDSGNPYDFPLTENVVKINDGDGNYHFVISELPQDTTWIIYSITDVCGNTTQCYTEVVVVDTEKPTPVCDGYTVVSLDDVGWADVFAETFDDGSWDNCEISHFEVKRNDTYCAGFINDLSFGDVINFCCEDVNTGYIKVTMRVYDVTGNFNDCVINVEVQDKFDPTIICPDNIHILCTDDPEDFELTGGLAIGQDNCSNLVVTNNDIPHLNDCGVGYIDRRWRVTDPQGRYASCTQRIYLDNPYPLVYNNIIWPNDIELDACSTGGTHPDSLGSRPIINSQGCNSVAIGYDDQYFYNVPGFCVKILRKWTVMDWCATGQGAIIGSADQVIKISNSVAPSFTSCVNRSIDSEPGSCEVDVTLVVFATDDCTPVNNLIYNWYIDIDNDGSYNYQGYGNDASRSLPVGTHRVKFTAEDDCENLGQCTFLVTVNDRKAPIPICYAEVVWALEGDGSTIVWASDFNFKSEDLCPLDGLLEYSFTPPSEGIQTSKTFTCDDIENGIAQLIPLQMYVIDLSGNYSYCDVTLNLQDNLNTCPDQAGIMASISGKVTFPNNFGIDNLEVNLSNLTDEEQTGEQTDNDGSYTFDNLGFYDTYQINAAETGSPMEGVSTLDLILIQRHVLKLKKLNDPYKIIAADIDNSGEISIMDIVELRKLILGKIPSFQNNNSWKYINANATFDDPEDPWDYQDGVDISSLYINEENADLYAVKIGDVDYTVMSNFTSGMSDSRYNDVLNLHMNDRVFDGGENVIVPIHVSDVMQVEGMQFTINFDANLLSFVSLNSDKISISDHNYNISERSNGKIAFSWNSSITTSLEIGDVLCNMLFKAKDKGQLKNALEISSDVLLAEVYDENYNVAGIQLDVNSATLEGIGHTVLLENNPNPFDKYTNIIFDLLEDQKATISIRDLNGKLLKVLHKDAHKGRNIVLLETEDLGRQGVLYYTLETENTITTRKMIIIK